MSRNHTAKLRAVNFNQMSGGHWKCFSPAYAALVLGTQELNSIAILLFFDKQTTKLLRRSEIVNCSLPNTAVESADIQSRNSTFPLKV